MPIGFERIKYLLSLTLPQNHLITIPAAFLGFLLASPTFFEHPFTVLFGLVSVTVALSSACVINSLTDYKEDILNKKRLWATKIPRREILIFLLLIYLTMFALGLLGGFWFKVMMLASFLVGFFYSVYPRTKALFPLNYITLGFGYGFISISMSYFTFTNGVSNFPWQPWFYFLLTTIASQVKDFEDFGGDKVVGIKTLSTLCGIKKAAKVYSLLLLGCYALIITSSITGIIKPTNLLTGVLIFPAAYICYRLVCLKSTLESFKKTHLLANILMLASSLTMMAGVIL